MWNDNVSFSAMTPLISTPSRVDDSYSCEDQPLPIFCGIAASSRDCKQDLKWHAVATKLILLSMRRLRPWLSSEDVPDILTLTRWIELDMMPKFDISNRNSESNILIILSLEVLKFLMESCEADRAAEIWKRRLMSRPPRKKFQEAKLMMKLMLRMIARSRLCAHSYSVFLHPIHTTMRVRSDVTLNIDTIWLTWTPSLTPTGKNTKYWIEQSYEYHDYIRLNYKLLEIDLMTTGKERALRLPMKD